MVESNRKFLEFIATEEHSCVKREYICRNCGEKFKAGDRCVRTTAFEYFHEDHFYSVPRYTKFEKKWIPVQTGPTSYVSYLQAIPIE